MEQSRPSLGATRISRRGALRLGAAGLVAGAGAGIGLEWLRPQATRIGPHAPEVVAAERARHRSGNVVRRTLTAGPTTVDLAGHQVHTWAFDGSLPGREIRAQVGDQLQVELINRLPDPTTVHWHGVAVRNDMDGVPGLTMRPVPPGGSFRYHFTLPDPGTYWFHPHVGVQLDTGLMGPLIIEDPREPLDYDRDVTLVLDDWTDGIGPSPKAILAGLRVDGMPGMQAMGGMNGMEAHGMHGMNGMGGMVPDSSTAPLGQDTGDVSYPLHLVNGRPAADPYVVAAKPGQRLRLRLINSGSDTAYRVAIGGHRLTVVAADGYAVDPTRCETLILGMGERYDLLVTAEDGAFPIVCRPEGKKDQPALAVLRTSGGQTPTSAAGELNGRLLDYADLAPTPLARLAASAPDRWLDVRLQMGNGGRQWLINGRRYPDHEPLDVRPGERVRLRLTNQTMMFHPMHLHGHTFAVVGESLAGLRKDTLNVLPMQRVAVDMQADNPGQWLLHCHNAYHGELGMMTVLSYLR